MGERFADLVERIQAGEAYPREAARHEISEQIFKKMRRGKVGKAELARRLGTSRSYVTRMLQGNGNFTLDKMADIARALGCEFELRFVERRRPRAKG